MKHLKTLAGVIVLGALLLAPGMAWAHGGPEVSVKPLTAKPGDMVTINGGDLGPNSMIKLSLKGMAGMMDMGEVQGDDDGGFTQTITLPADLKPGTYQLVATGGETASTQLTVVAAPAPPAGNGAMASAMSSPAGNVAMASTIGSAAVTSAAASTAAAVQPAAQAAPAVELPPVAPGRPLAQTAGLVVLFGVIAALGLFFARTARREPAA